ncbi:MAG: TIGR02147 family protein [Bdellovibrionota bacterium]
MALHSILRQPSVLDYSAYREFLGDYVQYSKYKSRSWSYGVWARKLGLKSKSTLTMILTGKRNPGKDLAERISETIGMSKPEKDHFLRLIDSERRTADPIARMVFNRGSAEVRRERRRQWLYLVLLDLCRLPDFSEDSEWIRNRLLLPLDAAEIESCLEEMIASGVLVRDQGRLKRSSAPAVERQVGGSLTEDEILRFHEDGSQASTEALLRVAREERTFLTSILRVSQSQVSNASLILARAQRELSALLESNEGDSIYELHLHLFPLTKRVDQ